MCCPSVAQYGIIQYLQHRIIRGLQSAITVSPRTRAYLITCHMFGFSQTLIFRWVSVCSVTVKQDYCCVSTQTAYYFWTEKLQHSKIAWFLSILLKRLFVGYYQFGPFGPVVHVCGANRTLVGLASGSLDCTCSQPARLEKGSTAHALWARNCGSG